ncbi:TPA: hypothetical protein ACX6NV_002017 [Photobacterium damselae]
MKSAKVISVPPKPEDLYDGFIFDDCGCRVYSLLVPVFEHFRNYQDSDGFFQTIPSQELEAIIRINSLEIDGFDRKVFLEVQRVLVNRQNVIRQHFLKRINDANKPPSSSK